VPETWYVIVALMLIAYTVLDGFDFGVGALHLLVARTNEERRQVLAAIGPFWDGNEVWLLAAGGALFVSFPRVLSSGISGFYFAIFLVVWCLILRGVAIEFRSHVADRVWRASWDFFLAVPSTLLPVFLGAALGNLLRGVPLTSEGWFELPLFTNFTAREPVGILDYYTVLVGLFSLAALLGHGAVFLAWKTNGRVQARSRRAGRLSYGATAILWPVVTLATDRVNSAFIPSLMARPLAWLLAVVAAAGLVTALVDLPKERVLRAFLGSCAFVAALAAATATCAFPMMLRATGGATRSLTVYNSAADPRGLRIALAWCVVGLPLACAYFVINFRLHRGKAVAAQEGEGY
jgi:cytochrome d ubiquinol oxidase subunit II